ncbi:MAG: biopolymer transporter ExbD [Bacteriovoracales bacterium]|nr:biopolymer transporter ExbD [Bacteriovoracales bacterium]
MSFIPNKKQIKGSHRYRLNLIPIMDAIFIFIFFLLMSAQFIKFNEIASEAPNIKYLEEEQQGEDEPLNLTLDLLEDRIVVKIKASGQVQKVLPLLEGKNEYDLKGLLREIKSLKENHIDETFVILNPHKSIPYKKIVTVIDTVRKLPHEEPDLRGKNKNGEIVETRKLFDQVIFENGPHNFANR